MLCKYKMAGENDFLYLAVIRKIVFLLFCQCSVINLDAQARQHYIDSLMNEITISQAQDTNRAICLYRLCWEFRKSDPKKSEQYGTEALQLSLQLNFQKGIGSSYNNLGGVYESQGDDVKALRYYMLALEAKRKGNDKRSIASTLNNIGIIYKKQEYYDRSLLYYREAVSLNKSSNNVAFLQINYYNMANSHKGLKNYDSAFFYYQLSLDLLRELDKLASSVDILNSIGNYYVDLQQYDKAIIYFDSSYSAANLYGHTNASRHFYFQNKGPKTERASPLHT